MFLRQLLTFQMIKVKEMKGRSNENYVQVSKVEGHSNMEVVASNLSV